MVVVRSSATDGESLRLTAAARLRQRQEQRRQARVSSRISFWDWSQQVPTAKGRLDFSAFPFQREFYMEGAEDDEAVWVKATQVGVSEVLLRWLMYWPDTRGANGLYVFPKLKQMTDFSDARVKATIDRSPYLQSRIPKHYTQNKGLKQIGGGFLYFRGSESVSDLESVDADLLGLDEYNRLVPDNIPVAERRISGPQSMGLIRRIGVPTIPNFGVSKHLAKSDWRRWFVKCEFCNERQYLTWSENVDIERKLRVCRKCRKELTPDVIGAGEWIATQESDVRGYHLPKLIAPYVKMGPLITRSQTTDPADIGSFWRFDMAEPWSEGTGKLTEDQIAAAMSMGHELGAAMDAGGYVGTDLITMGVDVASARALNVRVSRHIDEKRKVSLFIGLVNDFDQVARMMSAYGVHMCVVDHLPETRMAQSFAEMFAGRVYLCNYATENQADVLKVDRERLRVSVRRTEAMDATIQLIRELRNGLPERMPSGYIDQVTTPTRVVERGPDGRVRVRYESPGADDYFHMETYDLVATELWYLLRAVGAAGHTGISKLEDHMEFQRSALHDEEGTAYREGVEHPMEASLDDPYHDPDYDF